MPTRTAQPAREAQSAEPERAQTEASNRQEEHAQSSRRSKRAAQRETTTARRNAATLSRSSRGQDAKQASAWQRDFASDDGMPTGNFSGGWQDRNSSQAPNGWRDRGAERRWEERDSADRRQDRGGAAGRSGTQIEHRTGAEIGMWNIPATTTGASGLVATTISSWAERNVTKVR